VTDPQARRRRLADQLATELCDLPPGVWAARSQGANQSLRVSIEHEEVLADLMVEVWDLTRVRPPTLPYGGRRVDRLGLGPAPVPRRDLTADLLAVDCSRVEGPAD
jgi:hypothetical protein